jgi:hypothetical protein
MQRNAHSGLTALALFISFTGCEARRVAVDAAAGERGMAAARADIASGVLKQKEYPALPYSKQQMDFIKLLRSECGVVNEVVPGPGDSATTRAEVAAYNDVMRGEIARRFGADIFQKLRDKAEGKE